jgi:hypothetical protein
VSAWDFKSYGPDFIGTVGSIPTHFRHANLVSPEESPACLTIQLLKTSRGKDTIQSGLGNLASFQIEDAWKL